MTKQEIFNTVATHLFTQGKPAIGEDGMCRYRTTNGLKCAVGVLIRDADYLSDMEGRAIRELVGTSRVLQHYLYDDIAMLTAMQNVHDATGNWLSTDRMQRSLAYVAERHGLNTDAIRDLSFKDR